MVTVGKIRDAHGLKGELFVILFAGRADWTNELSELVLVRKEMDPETKKIVEKAHTFKIKRFKLHKSGMILKVDGLSDRTEAEKFAGSIVQITSEALISKPGEHVFLKELENFEVLDQSTGYVGKIAGFSSNGAQDLIVVKNDERSTEIPLIPEFISKLDFKAKRLEMILPEGLVNPIQ